MEDINLVTREIQAIEEMIKELRTKQTSRRQKPLVSIGRSTASGTAQRAAYLKSLQSTQSEFNSIAMELLESCLRQKRTKLIQSLKHSLTEHSKQLEAVQDYLSLKQAELAEAQNDIQKQALESYIAEGFKRIKLLKSDLKKHQAQLADLQAIADIEAIYQRAAAIFLSFEQSQSEV
ncbi:hypothetical protein [Leptolyngbya sp. FACHB-261]|uniref:hypothetical protein n=1 Tax=Leptolyngbya sp. FACHB-261 TaxID=2692806 RepID=UPI0016887ED8|nr:hypothetical protein [Leptolyngbya sp. FACHB-261]MBD2100189.1 hypothetical protein [Leptolyngbya sp. FACHB-261]